MEQDFKDKTPFYRKHLEVDEKSRVITFRLNQEEEALVMQARKLLDIEAEGKAIKVCFKIGLNVLQNTFGDKLLKYISSTKRERKSDYEKGLISQIHDSVIQKESEL